MSWYTIDLNCNEYFFIVLQNTAVVFPASSGSKANRPFHLRFGEIWKASRLLYDLNLAQITAEPLGTLLAAKRSPCCLSFS